MPNHTHLSLNDRITIQIGLENGNSRAGIAKTLGKDRSTIAKEIKKHRDIVYPKANRVNGKRPVFDCIHMDSCGCRNVCRAPCDSYEMSACTRRDKKVGVCNGCGELSKCRRIHYIYDAQKAFNVYNEDLHTAREGIDLTTKQAEKIASIVKPLIDQGQSIYAIVQNHPELNVCEKTLYNYITAGVFAKNGLIDVDLRLKTSRKRPDKKIYSKPRENRAYVKNRTYTRYLDYMSKHPNASVVEMDTVYNDVTNGPFIQTFEIVEYDLMIAFLHEEKTAASMLHGLSMLKERLGDSFSSIVEVLLTDRGSEFADAEGMEALGCSVFYCDPMCSCQKPNVENNHLMLRWILPKKTNLKEIGLETQEDLDLIFSHINSYPRETLKGKSAIELFLFYQSPELLAKLHLENIEKDQIILYPSLIKKK